MECYEVERLSQKEELADKGRFRGTKRFWHSQVIFEKEDGTQKRNETMIGNKPCQM